MDVLLVVPAPQAVLPLGFNKLPLGPSVQTIFHGGWSGAGTYSGSKLRAPKAPCYSQHTLKHGWNKGKCPLVLFHLYILNSLKRNYNSVQC